MDISKPMRFREKEERKNIAKGATAIKEEAHKGSGLETLRYKKRPETQE